MLLIIKQREKRKIIQSRYTICICKYILLIILKCCIEVTITKNVNIWTIFETCHMFKWARKLPNEILVWSNNCYVFFIEYSVEVSVRGWIEIHRNRIFSGYEKIFRISCCRISTKSKLYLCSCMHFSLMKSNDICATSLLFLHINHYSHSFSNH